MARSTATLPWPRCADDGTPLGVDIARKHGDIRRLVLKHFRSALAMVEADDLVQDVLLAIARRNRMPSAYDPRKASFSKYVLVVARSVVGNHAYDARRRAPEVALRPTRLGAAGMMPAPDVAFADNDIPEAIDRRTPEDALIEAEAARAQPAQLGLWAAVGGNCGNSAVANERRRRAPVERVRGRRRDTSASPQVSLFALLEAT